jgi:NitT/TauT family transport system permease protein
MAADALVDRASKPRAGAIRRLVERHWVTIVSRVVLGVLLLALWQLLAHLEPLFVARPWATAVTLKDWAGNGLLVKNTLPTIEEIGIGFAIGMAAGVVLGWLLASVPLLDNATRPYLDVANAIPRIGLAPLFVLWFGLGLESKVILVISVIIFVSMINAYSAVKSIEHEHLLLVKSLGATRWDVARKVWWPSSMPWLLASFRLGAAYAVGAAVVGEFVAASKGLGYLLAYRSSIFDIPGTYAALVLLGALAAILTGAVTLVEKRALGWQAAGRGGGTKGARTPAM